MAIFTVKIFIPDVNEIAESGHDFTTIGGMTEAFVLLDTMLIDYGDDMPDDFFEVGDVKERIIIDAAKEANYRIMTEEVDRQREANTHLNEEIFHKNNKLIRLLKDKESLMLAIHAANDKGFSFKRRCKIHLVCSWAIAALAMIAVLLK